MDHSVIISGLFLILFVVAAVCYFASEYDRIHLRQELGVTKQYHALLKSETARKESARRVQVEHLQLVVRELQAQLKDKE